MGKYAKAIAAGSGGILTLLAMHFLGVDAGTAQQIGETVQQVGEQGINDETIGAVGAILTTAAVWWFRNS